MWVHYYKNLVLAKVVIQAFIYSAGLRVLATAMLSAECNIDLHLEWSGDCFTITWQQKTTIGLSSVLRLRQHNIGYMANGFYILKRRHWRSTTV